MAYLDTNEAAPAWQMASSSSSASCSTPVRRGGGGGRGQEWLGKKFVKLNSADKLCSLGACADSGIYKFLSHRFPAARFLLRPYVSQENSGFSISVSLPAAPGSCPFRFQPPLAATAFLTLTTIMQFSNSNVSGENRYGAFRMLLGNSLEACVGLYMWHHSGRLSLRLAERPKRSTYSQH